VPAPIGGGNRNLMVLRDGIKPPVGSTDSSLQFDTYHGPTPAAFDWFGYTFGASYNFSSVMFQEGRHFVDGGWFDTLTVQVRQAGVWVGVTGLTITPSYPGNNGITFQSFTLSFTPMAGDGVRIYGAPGGAADFTSIAELEVYASP
jgi:hypothetical protein